MKAISVRHRAQYDKWVYKCAKIQKWLAENFLEFNKRERDSVFIAEFVGAGNSRLTAATTPQRRSYYTKLLKEMTEAFCKLNTDLNNAARQT